MPENSKNYDMPFPTRLRLLLDETHVSQQELADSVGVKRQTVAQWKDGKTVPDIYNFKKIAAYFEVPYAYLYGDTDSREQENIELCNTLGLPDKVLNKLKHWAEQGEFMPDLRRSQIASDLLEHEGFDEIIDCIGKQTKEYIAYQNSTKEDMPIYTLPDGELPGERPYEVMANAQDVGKRIATSKDLVAFYQYQSAQLLAQMISEIIEQYYVADYLTYHYEQE